MRQNAARPSVPSGVRVRSGHGPKTGGPHETERIAVERARLDPSGPGYGRVAQQDAPTEDTNPKTDQVRQEQRRQFECFDYVNANGDTCGICFSYYRDARGFVTHVDYRDVCS